jgi:predicted dienelactone hydrolase
MAPALGEAFTAEGLAPVSIPVQIVVGPADTSTPPASNALRFARLIKDAAAVVLEGPVGHYTFLAECTDQGREALPALCFDSPGVHRRAVHEQVSRLATQFFDRHLASA